MAEQLLNPMEVAGKLKISRTTFYEIRPKLIAKGLKTLRVGQHIKYLESSLDRLICKAAENEQPLV
jgi:predicted DNA-binding transcriptional regulator AlpA